MLVDETKTATPRSALQAISPEYRWNCLFSQDLSDVDAITKASHPTFATNM